VGEVQRGKSGQKRAGAEGIGGGRFKNIRASIENLNPSVEVVAVSIFREKEGRAGHSLEEMTGGRISSITDAWRDYWGSIQQKRSTPTL